MHNQANFSELTANIVSAYISNNATPASDLPALIAAVHSSLQGLSNPPVAEPEVLVPPVSIRKSITTDHLISMEDGKKYRALKRHLRTRGLTPDAYRAKWKLPADYPMVAPSYSSKRSELAKSAGLGQQRAALAKAKSSKKVAPRKSQKAAADE